MNKLYNKYYVKFPIYIHSYEILKENKEIEFVFYNINGEKINSINVIFGDREIKLDIDSDDEVIRHILKLDESIDSSFHPDLVSCVSNEETYFLKDYNENVFTIANPESVFSLGYERYLYTGTVSRALKIPKKDIQFVARENKYFWTCTCGNFNLSSFDSCKHCGNNKEKLFSIDIPIESEADKTTVNLKLYKSTLIWLFLMFFIQLAYQSFYGTFLFENQIINDFFPVFNRFILPSLMIFANITLVLSLMFYKENLKRVSYIVFYGVFIYFNIICNISFIKTAYLLLILIGINITLLGIVRFNYIKSVKVKPSLLVFGLTLVSTFLVGYQWSVYNDYDVIVKSDGLMLTVETIEEEYIVPDSIDGVNVSEVYFDLKNDYYIKDLTFGKNTSKIYMYSTAVLPYLENIYISLDNPNFYVSNNILYTKDDNIFLVPMAITSLTLNSEVIGAGEFRDLYNLEELVIGPNVLSISNEAFMNNINLRSITFDENGVIEHIGDNAFYNCQNLETIELPDTIQTLGVGVFERCNNLTYMKVPFIGEERENYGSLRDSTDVLVYMFGSRSYLDSDLIPNALETIEIFDIERIHNVTFYNANFIKSIILPSDLENIGIRSFYGCESLESFIVPSEVTIIDESAFENSGLKMITIPDSVVYIDKNAFKGCDDLETVIYEGDLSNLIISTVGNTNIIDILYPAG